ncbi:hypothetical protein MoryE10_00580 [Methylogaea oryzae]|uniref:Uncharacterized protein n=2 Tax=Methylogaea oryzae TaxID=1295382 RepID=A0A8D4VLR4_9GAMM|nr:hypothetical protein MoryE10_00580 [Methylogaea oryzae]
MSPATLDRAVIAYDRATTDILSKQLLLNIARAHQHQPMHFTGVSNIAATFNFQFNAGATPALTGSSGSLLTPIFGGTVSENPTVSIVPMEGEEFTRRLLTPIQETKLTMLLRQGADVDLVLRLIAGELRMRKDGREVVYFNRPSDATGYPLFRQAVLHLSTVQDRHALYVEPLIFERRWSVPAASLSPEQLAALQKEFNVDYVPGRPLAGLSKRVTGHILVTNYDTAMLSNEERIRLHEEADQGPPNAITVDIRPEYPGGELPFHGSFRFRSFHNVLDFIGQDIAEAPEYDVPRHPQTPPVSENPVHTMEVLVADSEPSDADVSVNLNGRYYAVKPDSGYQWNREAFRLLSQVFQMTMTELPQFGVPSITIAK